MAKQPSAFAGSRALGYQESYFANRNDMLQSALDSVLLSYQDEMTKYQAAVELYKDASGLIDKEKARLLKLRDDLQKEQIKGAQAAQQFNAGQLNSSARTGASIQATNDRFNAKQTALAAFYGTQEFKAGSGGAGDVLMNEVRQAYTGSPTDINQAMRSLDVQFTQTTEVPKTSTERDIGKATLVQIVLGDEVKKEKYSFLDPADQVTAAMETILAGLSPEDRASAERGIIARQQIAAGKGATLAAQGGQVASGGINTILVGEPDYSGLIADVDARLSRIGEAEKKVAPTEPEAPDLIDLQRREYFQKFYPNYVPAFQINEAAKGLNKLTDDEAAALFKLYKSRQAPTEVPSQGRGRMMIAPEMAGTDLSQFYYNAPYKYGKDGRKVGRLTDAEIEAARAELRAKGPQTYEQVPEVDTTLDELEMSGGEPIQTTIAREQEQLAEAVKRVDLANEDLKTALETRNLEQIDMAKARVAEAEMVLDTMLISGGPATRRAGEAKLEIEQADKPFTYPVEKRGGENVPFFRRPGGRADRKERERLTAPMKDANFKIKSAADAALLWGTPEFEKLLGTEVGSAVKELYEANKAKGDETGKEVLQYIAREFPRRKDQETATQVFYGLSYGDMKSGYLGAEEEKATEPEAPVEPATGVEAQETPPEEAPPTRRYINLDEL